ncbi:hypothetical protein PF010_g17346 [Phytophthora fragariae]|uniref:Uncharacterized protein n=1 Tax=Phytophthora fragariae TaxID=53985 RepID=A0A6A4CK99_9STRA|nr:hypothetical protein PF010_g17346 [Phytophthora fragariae]KAE9117779.1 hypothetical protein PF006_g18740 [Phytophthora fragariae]KAE9118667.1 hypothetical protein PF007_g8844 [Phytophthora fragariae]KAE9179513.1 hypothetical protein PF002_g27796 [Phytophthora fragariae]KAE9180238.1 hypothetical protein PF004_g24897 [Phytophthora fragariae]
MSVTTAAATATLLLLWTASVRINLPFRSRHLRALRTLTAPLATTCLPASGKTPLRVRHHRSLSSPALVCSF